MGKRSCIYLAVGLLLAVRPAFGHHAFSADFDHDKPVRLDGTVTRVELTDPHVYLFMDARDAAGKVTNWKIELGSRDKLEAQGFTPLRLAAGTDVNVRGWRAKDGSSFANADSITTDAGIRLSGASSYYGNSQEPAVLTRHEAQPRPAGTTGELPGELPRTAGHLALTGLIGLLSAAAAAGLHASSRGRKTGTGAGHR